MSTKLDYWPFDYHRYIEEIVSALRLATEGQPAQLQQLIDTGHRQGLSLCPPGALYEQTGAIYTIDAPMLSPLLERSPSLSPLFQPVQPAYATQALFYRYTLSWDFLRAVVPTLVDYRFGRTFPLGAVLHLGLIAAFCCAFPPEQPSAVLVEGDEAVDLWREYVEQDEHTRELWSAFYRPAPVELAPCTSFASGYESEVQSMQESRRRLPQVLGLESEPWLYTERNTEDYPRALFPFGYVSFKDENHSEDWSLDGFVTPEETLRLFTELPLRRTPPLSACCFAKAQDEVLAAWERHAGIEHFQEKKGLFCQQLDEIDQRFEEVLRRGENSPAARAAWLEEQRQLQEHLFGQELREELIFVSKHEVAQARKEEDFYFLVPVSVYRETHKNDRAVVRRWVEAFPDEAERMQRPAFTALWQEEDRLRQRLHFALTRQWGLLMCSVAGRQAIE